MQGRNLPVAMVFMLLLANAALSQNVTGTLSGTVKDPAGSVIPNAKIVLSNLQTGAAETSASNDAGLFVFGSVLPGMYNVEVSVTGFRTFQMRDVTVTANERRSLGEIVLQVGQVQERVEVTAEVTPVQTASAERAGLVTGDQMLNVAIKGRDLFGILSILPGIVDTNAAAREVVLTSNAAGGIHINGGRDTSIMVAVDGLSVLDTGSNASVHTQPNMDAVAEVKVLTTNYQAEYGRNSAGTVNLIIKNGTQNFHGTGYWYYRHEDLNANGFFLNRTGTPKPPYRINSGGGSLGGPIYVPNKFNRSKDKLFFFFSEEYVTRRLYPGVQFVTTPTALQRAGDYSQTLDLNGALIPIRDPSSGSPFPGNVVPKGRINALGQTILNFLPLPNYTETDPALRYARNYRTNLTTPSPRREDIIRLDYNITPTLRAYFRGIRDSETQEWPYGSWVVGSVNYDLTNTIRTNRGRGAILNITKVIDPSMVNEFTMGATTRGITFNPADKSKVARSQMGNIGQWYPAANESGAIPNVTFGGVPNYINPSVGNIPYHNENPVYTFVDNVSKLLGTHSLKAGIYIERMRKDEVGSGNTRGAFDFGRNSNNPFDSNWAFSNSLLGIFNSYAEATYRPYSLYRYTQVEWYGQDVWKVSRRLTLDFGVRFYNAPAAHDVRYAITTFDPGLYDPKSVAVLIRPGKNAAGQRVGIDPRNGQQYTVPYIGLFVPGSGNYAPGMVAGGQGYNPNLYDTPLVSVAPRFGFAWDPKGDGKTAIRGGIGIFYDRPQGNVFSATQGQPPVAYTPTVYFGTLDTFLQAQGTVGPSAVTVPQVGHNPLPRVMNFSFGVQRDIGFGTVVDAAYVGSVGRHLLYQYNINSIPMYAHFDPNNIDPTTGSPMQDNFLRPYLGLGNINERGFGGTSSYNSLQLTVNRRLSRGIQYGFAYTFSRSLGVGSADFDTASVYFPMRQRNYGPLTYDVTNVLAINYTWDLPDAGKRMNNRALGFVLDNWQVSGITAFMSGLPVMPGFSTTDSVDITGSTEGARINVVGDPSLPKGDRTFYRNFNTAAFARPAVRDFGNAGFNILRGPGVNNWDLSVSKRFPLWGEARYIQFRSEFYNAFNHTQFSGYDTTARFNPAGQQINANFGAYNAARDPRRIQLSLRLSF